MPSIIAHSIEEGAKAALEIGYPGSLLFVDTVVVGEREGGLYQVEFLFVDDVPEGVSQKEELRFGVLDDVVHVVGGEVLEHGYDDCAVGDGCQIGYHPAGVVSSYQRYLVSFLYAAFLEEQVQFGYLLGHLEIGEGLLFEVVGERGQLPVLPEALLVYLDKVFLHHKRIRLNDKVRIKKT